MELTEEKLEELTSKIDKELQNNEDIKEDIKEKNVYKMRYDLLIDTLSYIYDRYQNLSGVQVATISYNLLKKYNGKLYEAKEEIEPAEEKFYTIQEVADKLGYHHNTIRKAIKSGKLQAIRMTKEWRITESSLKNFLKN